jgi:putative ATP-dependent DNA ligase
MDVRPLLDAPGVDVDGPEDLTEHLSTRTDMGREYHALSASHHGLERGTVLVDGTVVRGFPSVPRVLHLEAGVTRFFESGAVYVEEKLNGYNVRIVAVDGEPLAFTRGGHLCPYTTRRAHALLDLEPFFGDHPDRMLCAEFIGPETPYTTHDYADVDSHDLRVFGVRDRVSGAPLSVDRRRDLCTEYGFGQPELFGAFDLDRTAARVHEVIGDLAARDREGVVMKSDDGTALLKYTTSRQHHEELAYAFELPFERGQDFLFSRVLREAFQAYERDESPEELRERAHEIGEAILLPFVETIGDVDAGEPVGEDHTVRGDPESVDALLDHVDNLGVTLEVVSRERDGDEVVVEFRKVAASTRDRVDYYLSGGTYDE